MDCSKARTKDPTEWVQTCPEFSWPLLEQVREWFLTWEPDLTESIKWNSLCYSGRKLVACLSGCKAHLGVSFFRGAELPDPAGLLTASPGAASVRTLRITTLEGFDPHALRALLQAATELDGNYEVPPPARVKRPPLPTPDDLAALLKRDAKAGTAFDRLSPTCKREYIMWITTARKPETRARRLQETLAAVKAGKVWMRRKEALEGKGGK